VLKNVRYTGGVAPFFSLLLSLCLCAFVGLILLFRCGFVKTSESDFKNTPAGTKHRHGFHGFHGLNSTTKTEGIEVKSRIDVAPGLCVGRFCAVIFALS
jgi:hypothetical protein